MTNDEVYLALLHSEIKSCAIVALNPKFNAMPRKEYRPFKLCLPERFKPSASAFFKLFFSNWVFDTLVQNTNLNARAKNARTVHNGIEDGKGRLWNLVNKHELSMWLALHIYMGLIAAATLNLIGKRISSVSIRQCSI